MGRLTAQGIYNICTPVAPEEAKAGDIIFFTGTYAAGEPVTHVGIYAGDGQMIHCGDPIPIYFHQFALLAVAFLRIWKTKLRGGDTVSIEKMKADLSKLNDKIGQLQRKAKDMEERILQAENMEYLKIIRKNGISAEELQLMIDISNEEQK